MQLSNKEKERLAQRYGSWAVVTGATSGIGLELAKQLAEAGLNLLLVSRQPSTLQQLQHSMTTQFGVTIRVIAADLSEAGAVEMVLQTANELPVGLFVACAGFGSSGPYINGDVSKEVNMLRLNCEAVLVMTHHFARQFSRQRRGGIILMSSIVAFQGVPFAAHYAATKAYIQSLAEALAVELKPFGVDVLAAAPGPVHSGFAGRAHMQMKAAASPGQVAVPILKALGKTTTVLPGMLSRLLAYSLRTVPRYGKVKIMAKVMAGMTKHHS